MAKNDKIFPDIICMFISEEGKKPILNVKYKQRGKSLFTHLPADRLRCPVIKAIQGHPIWSQKKGTIEWEKQSVSVLNLWQKAFLYSEGITPQLTGDELYDKCLKNTLNASVQRNDSIYENSARGVDKKELRDEFRKCWAKKLRKIAGQKEYTGILTSAELEKKHCENIHEIQGAFSEKPYKNILKGGKLNTGTAQKSLNLYLKYLWCLGEIETPPHCTIDSVVLEAAQKINKLKEWKGNNFPSWTKDCHDTDVYKDWINKIKDAKKAVDEPEIKNLAEWELYVWSPQ